VVTDRPAEPSSALDTPPAEAFPPFNRTFVVAATTSVQAVMSLAVLMLAAIAPAVATALGIPASQIGFQISIVYGSASIFSVIAGGMVRRWGACRTSQASLFMGLTGCSLATIPSVAAVAVASVFIGIGYAMTNPSASHLLGRFAGQRYRNVIFSIKQTGVPIGGAVAGLVAPPLAVHVGWRAVPVAVGIVLLALMLALQARRALWDDDRDRGWRLGGGLLDGLTVIWRNHPIRWLAASSFFYTITQLCLVAFLVTLLVEDVDMTLVEAGLVLSLVQVASVFGRLMWGWVADRVGDGAAVLAVIGVIAGLSAALATQISPAWPGFGLRALFVVFGIASIGWNGVFMAELARLSPAGRIGPTTGASLAVTFAGVMVGPSLFTVIHDVIGSYAATFGLLALASLAGTGLALLSRAVAHRGAAETAIPR
jgi:MFS family permease